MEEFSADLSGCQYIVTDDQIREHARLDLQPTPQFLAGFWSVNTPDGRFVTPSDVVLSAYCSPLMGPLCSAIRRRDYVRLLTTFTFWHIMADVVMYALCVVHSRNPFDPFMIDQRALERFGGVSSLQVRRGAWWRFLVGPFLHRSFVHLVIEVTAQGVVGLSMESTWGTLRFVAVEALAGLAGAAWCVVLNPGRQIVGTCPGLFGVLAGLTALYCISVGNLAWRHRVLGLLLLGVYAAIVFATAVSDSRSSVEWGQIGGYAFGAALGCVIFAGRAEPNRVLVRQLRCFGAVAAFVVMAAPFVVFFVWL